MLFMKTEGTGASLLSFLIISHLSSLFSSGFSQASHRCEPEAVGGYLLDKYTTCTCSFSSDGHPRGTAQWYQGGQLAGSGGTLVVSRYINSESYDDNVRNQL